MTLGKITPIFSAAFALAYVFAVELNIAVVTYFPRADVWGMGTRPAPDAHNPAMYWYGWLITAAAAAVVASAVALPFVRDREPPAWIGWAIPLAVMVSFLYFLRSFFIY